MLTTESFPAKVFPLWKISQDNPYVIGDFTWTAMDYLGESGIGAWSYGTPEQAKMDAQIMGAMMTTATGGQDVHGNGQWGGYDGCDGQGQLRSSHESRDGSSSFTDIHGTRRRAAIWT